MMRMSLKKLRKIGDPEKLLHRAVLINNTLDCIRNDGMACKNESSINTYAASNYSTEEEQILNSIQLPPPITPISEEAFKEENSEVKGDMVDNSDDGVMECLLRPLPNNTSAEAYSKSDESLHSDMIYNSINQPSKENMWSLLYNCTSNKSYLIAF